MTKISSTRAHASFYEISRSTPGLRRSVHDISCPFAGHPTVMAFWLGDFPKMIPANDRRRLIRDRRSAMSAMPARLVS
jgi:hypothetical protein